MNTPTHIVVNLLILGKKGDSRFLWPILIGALLPDLPMLVFYFYEKVIQNTPERIIWSTTYYQAGWQAIFDIFNSFPLIIIGLLAGFSLRSRLVQLLFTSMGLHAIGDLLLHNQDAHRHFFPLSSWRFRSPISYWDPAYYGNIVAPLEALATIMICIVLFLRFNSLKPRALIAGIFSIYAIYWGYALLVWI